MKLKVPNSVLLIWRSFCCAKEGWKRRKVDVIGVREIVRLFTLSLSSSGTYAISSQHYRTTPTPTNMCCKHTQARSTVLFCALRYANHPKIPVFASGEAHSQTVASYNHDTCASRIWRLFEQRTSARNALINHIVARWSLINRTLPILPLVQMQVLLWFRAVMTRVHQQRGK